MVDKKAVPVCADKQDRVAQKPLTRRGRRSNRPYNEQLLVEMLADGRQGYEEIAAAAGLSPSMVGKIARGEQRSDLALQIRQLRARRVQELAHFAVAWARPALQAHVRDGLEGSGDTARRCREYIIKMAREYNALEETFKQKELDRIPKTLDSVEAVVWEYGERATRKWQKELAGE